MQRSASAHSDEKKKKIKKTKSVDKIKSFSKAVKSGNDSCCGGHSGSAERKPPKSGKTKEKAQSQVNLSNQ